MDNINQLIIFQENTNGKRSDNPHMNYLTFSMCNYIKVSSIPVCLLLCFLHPF